MIFDSIIFRYNNNFIKFTDLIIVFINLIKNQNIFVFK
jgi:hypothetical protein